MLCTGPFTYSFVSYPSQCRTAVGGRRSVTILICRMRALDAVVPTTAGLTFDPTGFVTLKLHLGLWVGSRTSENLQGAWLSEESSEL